jgi:hypothetical protein
LAAATAQSIQGPAAFIKTHIKALPEASRAYWTALEGDAKVAP